MKRPISVAEAAAALGIKEVSVLKRIRAGTLVALPLSGKGLMVCQESVDGEKVDPAAFRRACAKYVSIPEACDIVCVTDGMIGRMLADGRLKGFKLNEKAWAVERKSCEDNIREYLASPHRGGRPRLVGEARAPKKRAKGRRRQKSS